MPIIPLSLSCETCMSLHYGSKKQREDFGNMKKKVSQGKKNYQRNIYQIIQT